MGSPDCLVATGWLRNHSNFYVEQLLLMLFCLHNLSYCFIADWLAEQPRYRTRGPQPTVSDAEILTIEVVGI